MLQLHPFHPFADVDRYPTLVPYWNQADHSSFADFSNTVGEITNNDQKFEVLLDVSHFRPENLKVNLNGRELLIEGEQESKNEHGYSKRSFSRMFLLPENADLASISSKLMDDGKLDIEVNKKESGEARKIPISFQPKHTHPLHHHQKA